jgi:amino acid permease
LIIRLNVSQDPPAAASTIGRAAIVVLVMFSYPLQIHPCRASVDAVLKWRPQRRNSPAPSATSSPPLRPALSPPKKDEMSDVRFAILTATIIILSYLVAMTVSSLEAVLAYVGSTGSTSISFILPGLFYYKISSPDSPVHQRLMKNDDMDDYDDGDEYEEYEGQEDTEHNPLLASSIASLHSLSRGAKKVAKRVWPKDLLRKLSLGLAVYGVLVMVVCLVTNTFLLTKG